MRIRLSLGRYEIIRHLETGELTELRLGRMVGPQGIEHHILQWIRPDQADDALVSVFFEQARRAAYLRHPNIAGTLDVVEEPGVEYLATEYVHGESLQRVLDRVRRTGDQVPIALLVGIAGAVAAGLHHAHSLVGPYGALGIVHGDVSPANIIIGYDGSVKVTGFGIAPAALHAAEARPAVLGRMAPYLSPEVVTGRPYDPRSDVFALGAVMYELATARPLFRGANDFLTMSAIAHGDVPRPSRYRPALPRALEGVIMKALETSPEDRYPSAEELRAALSAFANAVGMRISVASVADYMRKLFGVRPAPWLTVEDAEDAEDMADAAAAAARARGPAGEAGVATAPAAARDELALPASARRSTTAPIVRARQALLDDATAGTPGHEAGDGARTPLSWSTQSAPPSPRRRLGLLIAASVVSAFASFFLVGRLVRANGSGAASAIVPMTVTAPPPPLEMAVMPSPPPPPPLALPAPTPAKLATPALKPVPPARKLATTPKLAPPAPKLAPTPKLAPPAPPARTGKQQPPPRSR